MCTLQEVQHRSHQLHLPRQILQQVRQELRQFLIHCSFQEITYLNVFPRKTFSFKGEKTQGLPHKVVHSSLGYNLTLSFLSMTTRGVRVICLEHITKSILPSTTNVSTSTTSTVCITEIAFSYCF